MYASKCNSQYISNTDQLRISYELLVYGYWIILVSVYRFIGLMFDY